MVLKLEQQQLVFEFTMADRGQRQQVVNTGINESVTLPFLKN